MEPRPNAPYQQLSILNPMSDCTHIPLLAYSLDDITALKAKLWQFYLG